MKKELLFLLTNDDGFASPGLWAAAAALAPLGTVTVVAPREQWSGAGRSLPAHSAGRIFAETRLLNGQPQIAYMVEGTPAQAVQHAVLELLPRLPDLVVAGINYGENVGSGVTISGTIGAALEGAGLGIPALAVSLQTAVEHNLTHSQEIDFSAAAYFTRKFAERLLFHPWLPDVDALKIEVPQAATPATPWRLTRLSRERYYYPLKPQRVNLTDAARMGYQRRIKNLAQVEADSDVAALLQGWVAVTPLSLDITSRVDFAQLANFLTGAEEPPACSL